MSTKQTAGPHAASNTITFSPRARRVIRFVARIVNPLVLRVAGRRWMPILGILHHRGRRSGRAYATPLGMRPLRDGFVMPRTFGANAAWYHNVQAAGWAVVTWGGADHTVFQPQVVDAASAKPAFPRYERRLFVLLGIDEFLLLRRAPAGWRPDASAGGQMRTSMSTRTRPEWLSAAEFPFTSHQLAIDGHLIHYLDEGVGPTMMFVHAGPAWSFVYRDLIVRLRERFRCVALDLPGTGLSRAAAGYRPSIHAGAAIFGCFVRALDLRQVTLITHDVGTPVALGAAVRMPERFAALSVTEGSPGRWPTRTRGSRGRCASWAAVPWAC
jgi:deazaflavin-dependent oxidoreductase (nitroreductase family)